MRQLKRGLALWIGGALALVGFLILLLPGPLGWPGIPPLLLGLVLILSAHAGARRWFIKAAREDRIMLGPFRAFLRRRQRKRAKNRQGGPAS
jgi:hypothetical protein